MMMSKRENKYLNKKIVEDGILFDSKRECQVYRRLKELEARGVIAGLILQPMWVLQPKLTEKYVKHLKTKDKIYERTVLLPITYTADFSFIYHDELHVLDVKASKYMLPPEYRLKAKMLRYVHGISVREIYKLSDLDIYE